MTASTIPHSPFGHVARLTGTRGLRHSSVRSNYLAERRRRGMMMIMVGQGEGMYFERKQ